LETSFCSLANMGKVCSKVTGRDGNIDIGMAIDEVEKLAGLTGLTLPEEAHNTAMRQVSLTGRKRSLLVGINYCGTQNELHGCANDVKRMQPVLEKLGFAADAKSQIVLLDDDCSPERTKPTRANILQGLEWLVKGAQEGDALFFHYSGHGGQEPAQGTSDGFHETLVPLDFQSAGMLNDNDLFDTLVKPLPGGCRLTCILDSCHSAGALNLPYRFVVSEAELKKALASQAYQMAMSKEWAKDVEKWKKGTKVDLLKDVGSMGMGLWNLRKQATNAEGGDATGFKVEEQQNIGVHVGDVVAITGCRSDQTSADVGDVSQQFHLKAIGSSVWSVQGHLVIDSQRAQGGKNDGAGGALTTAFLETLANDSEHKLSYLDLLEEVRKGLSSKGFAQVPQFATSLVVDLQQPFALDTTFAPEGDGTPEKK
jgi:hypothetical protein